MRYAARRVLLAPVEDVWGFIAEPYHLADWWPGITGVEPDRRGFAPGARWKVLGPRFLRKPETSDVLLVRAVESHSRLVFELPGERIVVELVLRPLDASRTEAALTMSLGGWQATPLVFVPLLLFFVSRRGTLPKLALKRLYDLIQTAAEL